MSVITIERDDLQEMLTEAARQGAQHAFAELTVYSLGDACKRLDMSYKTLQRRIHEGKISAVDGKITGAEIQRYLKIYRHSK